MWRSTLNLLHKHPILYDSLLSGSLYATGDIICQYIERNPDTKYDFPRTLRMAIYGTCVFGPVGSLWYRWLEHSVTAKTPFAGVLKRVALDEIIFAPVTVFAFFVGISLLQGKTPSEGVEIAKNKFWPTFKVDLMVWPAAQTINFYFVSIKYRMLFINIVNVFWNAFMSSQSNH